MGIARRIGKVSPVLLVWLPSAARISMETGVSAGMTEHPQVFSAPCEETEADNVAATVLTDVSCADAEMLQAASTAGRRRT
jgi:hypothetical protein